MATSYRTISATNTSLTTGLDGRTSATIVTSADVYVVLFPVGEEPRAATSSDALLQSTDAPINYSDKRGFVAISTLAATTATVRVFLGS